MCDIRSYGNNEVLTASFDKLAVKVFARIFSPIIPYIPYILLSSFSKPLFPSFIVKIIKIFDLKKIPDIL